MGVGSLFGEVLWLFGGLYGLLETTLFLNASGDLLAALAGSLDKEARDLRCCSSTMSKLPDETALISWPVEDPGCTVFFYFCWRGVLF